MQVHSIQPSRIRKKKKRVGRGGKRGTYSGRGIKGQRARAGGRIRPALRDSIKKMPKKRGYRFSSARGKPVPVNIGTIDKAFESGGIVSPETLAEKKIIKKGKKASIRVKILGKGSLSKKITVSGCLLSETAWKAVEEQGGAVREL